LTQALANHIVKADTGGAPASLTALASALLGRGGPVDQLRLPRMAEGSAPQGPSDSRLNDAQASIIKDLAGGARFHDPSRHPCASNGQAKNTCLIDVRSLRFCHATISPHFMHGQHRGLPVLTLLEDLHAGLTPGPSRRWWS